MFKTLLEEYQAVQNQNKQEVKEVQFNKPFPDSKLYEHSSKELSEILYEERRKSYLIPKGSIQETQFHAFVEEAVTILEFVQSAGHTFVNSIQKSKEAHEKGDADSAKAHFKNAKKSRYNMNEKDLDQATPHFKAYRELQKHYDDKPNVAESMDEAAYDPINKSRLKDRTPRQQAAINAYKSTKPKQPKLVVHINHEDGTVSKSSFKMKHGSEDEAKEIAAGHLKNIQYIHDQFPKISGSRGVDIKKYEIKESEELNEGTKILTFSGQDSNKNPYHVHIGKDEHGNKYHVISGRQGVNHHPSAIFGGSQSEAEGKMNMVSRMVVQGKHDDALKRLNSMSHIKFSKHVEESEELSELSTELLGRYKKAASASASAADAKKDFKTGNKRFSGIMKATNKQFDNDMKKLRKESSDIELDEAITSKHISALKTEYGKIDRIDPSTPEYKKLTGMLDRLNKSELEILAKADIKFVSGLARNRINRVK